MRHEPLADVQIRYPDIVEPSFWRLYETWRGESLLSVERLYALHRAAHRLARARIGGAIVECGIYKGGSLALVLATLVELEATEREVFVYDTFQGFPEGIEDRDYRGRVLTREAWVTEPFLAVAQANLARTGYPAQRIRLIEGRVEATIPAQAPPEIAQLHLDTDYYGSTLHELEHLYPRLASGGLLFIDDYGHFEGCRRAVDEYFGRIPDAPYLHRTDYTGRVVVKP